MNVVLLNVDTGEILNSTTIAPNKTYSDVVIDYIDKDNGYILMSFNPTNNMRVKLYKVDVNSSNEISVTDVSNNSYAIQTINGATQDYTFGYLKFINKNISYYVGKYGSGNLDYNIYTAFMVGVNKVIKCNESIIPNDELSYAIIDGEIKQFSFDYENNMYNYSDLENPIQLYNNLSDGIYYIGKWVDNNTIAVLDTNNNVTIYDVNIESGTSSVLDTSTIYSENKIIEFQNNIFNSGFIVNKNDTLSVNTKKYTGYELIKLSKDEKDYVYQTVTTATPNDIRRNITAYSNGEKITGTMIDNGDVTIAPTTSEQVKEQGYYNSLKVSAVTSAIDSNIVPENIKSGVSVLGVEGTLDGGIDTSDADATADDIVSPKTAYVNGEKITGTINADSETFGDECDNVTIYPNGVLDLSKTKNDGKPPILWTNGRTFSLTIQGTDLANTIGLTADKIKKGETILGITGTYEGIVSQEEYEQAVDTTEQILGIDNTVE